MIPIVEQMGVVPTELELTEATMVNGLVARLEKLGFTTTMEALTAPRFPGFSFGGHFGEREIQKLRGVKQNPDARPIDILAWRDSTVLLIEAKIKKVEHGLGQILLYGEIFKRNRLHPGQEMNLILAAPDRCWHPSLPALATRCGVIPWQLASGRWPSGGASIDISI